jgi:hypothetical protein
MKKQNLNNMEISESIVNGITMDDEVQMVKISIIKGGYLEENPRKYVDKMVSKYVDESPHNSFILSSMDYPFCRIIIDNINNLQYEPFENQKLDDMIQRLRDKKIFEVLSE